jgi:hypothetical protein
MFTASNSVGCGKKILSEGGLWPDNRGQPIAWRMPSIYDGAEGSFLQFKALHKAGGLFMPITPDGGKVRGHHSGEARAESEEKRAEGIVREGLARRGWREPDLVAQPAGSCGAD